MAILSRVAAISPFGPIFGKELRTTSRRKRTYILRSSYLILLLLALLVAWLSVGKMSYGGLAQRAQRQAELGAIFFAVFSFFCVCVMGLIGPVLTATAVGSERLAKTLPVLLMTPINTWQIIGGKLFSRLLVALTLLGLSLPVLALVRLLGGVELSQMLAVLAICTTFVLATASIGLFFSCLMNRAYAVILLSFATLGFLYAFVPLILALTMFRRERDAMPIFAAINPVFATACQAVPEAGAAALRYTWLPCCIVNLVLTAFLVLASAAILRKIARTAGEKATPVAPEASYPLPVAPVSMAAVVPVGLAGSAALTPPPLPVAPSLPYAGPQQQSRSTGEKIVLFPFWLLGWPFGMGPLANRTKSREVFENAVLWREVQRPLLAKPWQRITAVTICVSLLLMIYGALADGHDLHRSDSQIGFAIIMHGLVWLLVAILSSTAIASEKESDTWTLLLATPLTGKQIVWGKFAGLCRRMFWPMMLVVAHFSIFVLTGVIHPASIVLILWVMITFNLPWMAIGLWLSLRMKRVTFAVITNLMLTIVICAVPPAILFVLGEAIDEHRLPEHTLWYIPYYFLGEGLSSLNRHNYYGYNSGYGYSYDYSHFRLPGGSNVAAGEYTLIVGVIGLVHVLIALLFLLRTADAFDQIVGRAGKLVHIGPLNADTAAGTDDKDLAPIWRRLIARIIDNLILGLTGGLIGMVVALVMVLNRADAINDNEASQTVTTLSWLGVQIGLILGAVPYYVGFESSRWRATPGKAFMRIFVTDTEGRQLTFLRALGRHLGHWLSGISLVGYFLALFTRRRQALHDLIAGTVVVHR